MHNLPELPTPSPARSEVREHSLSEPALASFPPPASSTGQTFGRSTRAAARTGPAVRRASADTQHCDAPSGRYTITVREVGFGVSMPRVPLLCIAMLISVPASAGTLKTAYDQAARPKATTGTSCCRRPDLHRRPLDRRHLRTHHRPVRTGRRKRLHCWQRRRHRPAGQEYAWPTARSVSTSPIA